MRPTTRNLLQRREAERLQKRERLRTETLEMLRAVLREVLPGQAVYVYGSILQPGRFRTRSDIDLALVEEPTDRSIYRVQAQLETALRRPVDLCVLGETRLRRKIETEGQRWTN